MIKGTEEFQNDAKYDFFAKLILGREKDKVTSYTLAFMVDSEFNFAYLNEFLMLSTWDLDIEGDCIKMSPRNAHDTLLLHSKMYRTLSNIYDGNKKVGVI